MTPVIGIDLGTTNTVVAVVRDGQATAIADETGHTLIPSVVSFPPDGQVLVGQAAKARRSTDPENTIYSVKRLIGRSADSEEIKKARARFPFEMREGPGQAALVVARGETYTLPEISAFVLRKARAIAEAYLKTPVERAVITVPANFNDLQRAATKVAGRVAGLEVLRILNEPTAAALAYGFGKTTSERVAVYDFGGGTFDVTLLDLSDNVFEVLATAGNTFLGGDDIDVAIAERMISTFLTHQRQSLRESPGALEKLRAAAEHVKHALSTESEAIVSIDQLAAGALGRALGLKFKMTRAEFEGLAGPIIDRTFDVCRDALKVAKASANDFGEILLVGGSTRVPLVRKKVEEFFQRPIKANISPDEVVAIGAAIQANALTGTERRRGTVPLPPAAARRVPTIAGPGPGANPAGVERPRTDTIPGVAMPGAPPVAVAPAARVPAGLGLGPPPRPRREPEAPREQSAAFTLSDDDVEEVLGISGLPFTEYSEDEITLGAKPSKPAPLPPPAPPAFDWDLPKPPARPLAPREPSAPWELQRGPASVRSEASAPWELPRGSAGVPSEPSAPWELQRPSTTAPLSAPVVPAEPRPVFAPESVRSVAPPPLLIDVTPLTLCVETVRGFCDPVIQRNTPVPCEQTREFVTAADAQTSVRIRVAQGESRVFEQNTLLGEVELTGLEPLPRGTLKVAVTFALDANGMLNVSAKELHTGRKTAVELRLVGLPDAREIMKMTEKHGVRQAV